MTELEVTIIIGTGCYKPMATLVTTCSEPNDRQKSTDQILAKFTTLYEHQLKESEFSYIVDEIQKFYDKINVCCTSKGSRIYKRISLNGCSIELVFTK